MMSVYVSIKRFFECINWTFDWNVCLEKATNYETRSTNANETNIVLRCDSVLLFCSASAETRHSCLHHYRPKAVVAHRRVKQAVSNPRKTAADDNKRLTDEEGYRARSDDWMGRSSRRGGATPGAWGQNRKTQRKQTDAPSVDKLGYERLILRAINPARGKIFIHI